MSNKNVQEVSKIVSFKIENFMSIKDAFLEFDDTNIIDLCGYNDSGKSAITRLFDIMFYNNYSTEQNRYITDGEEYWVGQLTFSDGVVYTRKKYLDGKSLWELTKGDTVLFTNLLPNGSLAAMSDTPDPIKQFLGVIQDELTGEELNVRRNTDKLFLISTSGGDNYKILNAILHSETLSQASKNLNDDKNKLNQGIQEKTTIQQVLTEQLEDMDVAPDDEIDRVKYLVDELDSISGQLLRLSGIAEIEKEVSNIAIFDKLDEINVDEILDLQDIMELSKIISEPIYELLQDINIEELKELKEIMLLKNASDSSLYAELEALDIDEISKLEDILSLYKEFTEVNDNYSVVDTNLNELKGKLTEISEKYNLKVCPNCGTMIVT